MSNTFALTIPSFYVDVDFDVDGGYAMGPTNVQVPLSHTVTRPANPARTGYVFVGWYRLIRAGDFEIRIPFDFDAPVLQNLTLVAQWAPVTPETISIDLGDMVYRPGLGYVYLLDFGDAIENSGLCRLAMDVRVRNNHGEPVAVSLIRDIYSHNFSRYPVGDHHVTPGSYVDLTIIPWDILPALPQPFEDLFMVQVNGFTVARILATIQINPRVYTVTFDTGGGTEIAPLPVVCGERVGRPASPTREGYVFAGWMLDGVEFNFNTPITEDITLTARWIPESTDTPELEITTPGGTTLTRGSSLEILWDLQAAQGEEVVAEILGDSVQRLGLEVTRVGDTFVVTATYYAALRPNAQVPPLQVRVSFLNHPELYEVVTISVQGASATLPTAVSVTGLFGAIAPGMPVNVTVAPMNMSGQVVRTFAIRLDLSNVDFLTGSGIMSNPAGEVVSYSDDYAIIVFRNLENPIPAWGSVVPLTLMSLASGSHHANFFAFPTGSVQVISASPFASN